MLGLALSLGFYAAAVQTQKRFRCLYLRRRSLDLAAHDKMQELSRVAGERRRRFARSPCARARAAVGGLWFHRLIT
ncbi:MAG: hypothetical protein ACK52I_14970 [Pseudomonadota bacterium]